MKKKVLWLMVSFLLVAALVLASCGPAVPGEQEEEEEEEEEEPVGEQEEEEEEPAVGEPQYGGTLTRVIGTEPPNPDFLGGCKGSCNWLEYMQERLLIGDVETYGSEPRGNGEYDFLAVGYVPTKYRKGHLAESWEISLDEIVWHVRPGVYWAPTEDQIKRGVMVEPRELTAEDLAEDIIEFLRSSYKGRFVGLLTEEGVHVKDRYTVVLELESYAPMLMYYLGYEDRPVICPPETRAAGAEKWENQIGTGPWMFEEYIHGSHMSFARNANYWDTTVIDGVEYQLPFIERVVLATIPDYSTQIAALSTGIVDLHQQVRIPNFESIDKAAPELLKKDYLRGIKRAWFRCDEPPFDDINVRRALMISTDIKAFHRMALATGFPLVYDPIMPGNPAYTPLEELPEDTQELYTYNPDKARQILAKAGYPEGLKTEIIYSSEDIAGADVAALLEDYWAKIGVEVELRPLPETEFDRERSPRPNILVHGLNIDTSAVFDPLGHLEGYCTTTAYMNFGAYSNPELDELVTAARVEFDPVKQENLIRQAGLIWQHDCVEIPLYPMLQRSYWWPWIKNYYGEYSLQDDCSWAAICNYMWIDQDLKAEMGY